MAILNKGLYESVEQIDFSDVLESFNKVRYESHREMMMIMEAAMEADVFIERSVFEGTMEAEEADKETVKSSKSIKDKIKGVINKFIDALKKLYEKFTMWLEQLLKVNAVKKYGEDYFKDMKAFTITKQIQLGVNFPTFNKSTSDIEKKLNDYIVSMTELSLAISAGKKQDFDFVKDQKFVEEDPVEFVNASIDKSETNKMMVIDQSFVNEMVKKVSKMDDHIKSVKKHNKEAIESLKKLQRVFNGADDQIVNVNALKEIEARINNILKANSIYLNTLKENLTGMNAVLIAVAKFEMKVKRGEK